MVFGLPIRMPTEKHARNQAAGERIQIGKNKYQISTVVYRSVDRVCFTHAGIDSMLVTQWQWIQYFWLNGSGFKTIDSKLLSNAQLVVTSRHAQRIWVKALVSNFGN